LLERTNLKNKRKIEKNNSTVFINPSRTFDIQINTFTDSEVGNKIVKTLTGASTWRNNIQEHSRSV